MKKLFRIIRGVCFVLFWATAILYLTQDIQIFPSVLTSKSGSPQPSPRSRGRIESIRHRSLDGTTIEVWKYPATRHVAERQHLRALVLHGNGGSLPMFVSMQEWLAEEGVTNYAFDYRGTGASDGWPSEAGIFLDSLSIHDLIVAREKVKAEDIILVGLSIGSGFATGVAAEKGAKGLVLFSPYQSIPALAADRALVRYLTPLLRYEVNTANYLRRFTQPLDNGRCVVIGHGEIDTIIPIAHSERLVADGGNFSGLRFKRYPGVGHNDLFHRSAFELSAALFDCLG
jgi:pimeloyl-ACP methyl ester carboxylesterase